jgi:serine/threonine-protein kinase
MVVGTAQYLSPEQAQGMEVNAASDVYSLGIVAYECLTGGRPFDGTSQVAIALAHINRQPPPLPPEVPPAVRLLVERALAKDPADRFPDGGAFADAVRRVAAGGAPTPVAVPVGPFTAPTQVVGDSFADGKTTVLAAQTGALTGTRALTPATGAAGPMPPLQGPGDDDDWLADDADPAPATRRRWPWLLAGLLLLLLVGGGTFLLLNQGDGDDANRTADRTSTSSSTSAPASGVAIAAAGTYVGRDADQVQTELEALGLQVRQEPADEALLADLGTDFDPNDVASIVPAGQTVDPATTTVVLTVAADGWTVQEEAPEEVQPTQAPQTTESTAPTTTEAPTTTSSSTSTSTSTSTTSTSTSTSTSTPPSTAPGTTAPTTSETTPPPAVDPQAEAGAEPGAAAAGVTG